MAYRGFQIQSLGFTSQVFGPTKQKTLHLGS